MKKAPSHEPNHEFDHSLTIGSSLIGENSHSYEYNKYNMWLNAL